LALEIAKDRDQQNLGTKSKCIPQIIESYDWLRVYLSSVSEFPSQGYSLNTAETLSSPDYQWGIKSSEIE